MASFRRIFALIVSSCFLTDVSADCRKPSSSPDKACRSIITAAFNGKGSSGDLSCKGGTVWTNVLGTGYFPSWSGPEGGCYDMKGKPLATLQDFLDGKVNFVSVAMDKKISGKNYGKEICIPELNNLYKKRIRFQVVDHGPSFDGRGGAKVDICTRTEKDSCSKSINRKLTVHLMPTN